MRYCIHLHRSDRGFAIAPILYLLGLIGVGSGILFSSYSQILRTNQNMSNTLAAKNELQGTATTLAATFLAEFGPDQVMSADRWQRHAGRAVCGLFERIRHDQSGRAFRRRDAGAFAGWLRHGGLERFAR